MEKSKVIKKGDILKLKPNQIECNRRSIKIETKAQQFCSLDFPLGIELEYEIFKTNMIEDNNY